MTTNISELLANDGGERTVICLEHGEYVSYKFRGLRIWSRCPACATDAAERERVAGIDHAKRQKLEAWQKEVGHSGIPERFQNRTLQNYKAATEGQIRALKFATEYANGFDEVLKTGRCAIFVGKVGTGKTHLSAGIGLRLIKNNHTVLFTSVFRAIRRVKDTWSKNSEESETQAIASMVKPDLLIVDEVGVQFGSGTERLILFDILNERYEKRKPVLLLSNLGAELVGKFLGERIFDRLREDGGEMVVFDWESERPKINQPKE